MRQQRAADRDTLAFSARQSIRASIEQCADAQKLNDVVELHRTGRRAAHAEAQVGGDGHVRKQFRVLKHQTGAALFGRQPKSRLRIDHGLAIDHDPACIGPQQSGGGQDQCRFARARGAEQRRYAG